MCCRRVLHRCIVKRFVTRGCAVVIRRRLAAADQMNERLTAQGSLRPTPTIRIDRLEGIRAPKARIEAIVLRDTRPKNRSEQEIAGYRDALNLIHQSGREMPFSANVILRKLVPGANQAGFNDQLL